MRRLISRQNSYFSAALDFSRARLTSQLTFTRKFATTSMYEEIGNVADGGLKDSTHFRVDIFLGSWKVVTIKLDIIFKTRKLGNCSFSFKILSQEKCFTYIRSNKDFPLTGYNAGTFLVKFCATQRPLVL